MKLSKVLLSSIAVGVAFGTSSCSLGDIEITHYDYCQANCEIDHSEARVGEEPVDPFWNCPACGMG